jgi:hypothetical protein
VRELSFEDVPAILGEARLNLIRRGADGSLRLSADHWRLFALEPDLLVFQAELADEAGDPRVLEVERQAVLKLTWDRLPKQLRRSQLRLHLRDGDLMTFSGELGDPA